MSLSPITSSSLLSTSPTQTTFQQRRSDFQQLAQALQSGDLGAAQTAYTALTNGAPSSSANSNSPMSQDMTAIGKALQSGDLAGAQQAFGKLQQDFKAQASQSQGTQGAHHGRHHHHHADADSSSTSTTTTTPTTGSVINLTA